MRILRLERVLDRTGDTKSPLYSKTQSGLFPTPIKIGGARAAGWPEHEVDAVIAARIAGKTDEQIRALVRRLHEARQTIEAEAA